MKELYINIQLVDFDGDLPLQYKSFLFSGIANVQQNRSWTVELPQTARNKAVIQQSHVSDYSGTFPYRTYTVDYWDNGYQIIKAGKAIMTAPFKFVFTWGNIYDILKSMSEKKLTELTEDEFDVLSWNKDDIRFQFTGDNFGWALWYHYTNEDRSFPPNSPKNENNPYYIIHPAVSLKWLISKIADEFSIDLDELYDQTILSDLVIPLRRKDGISSMPIESTLDWEVIDVVSLKLKFTEVTQGIFSTVDNGWFDVPDAIYCNVDSIENLRFNFRSTFNVVCTVGTPTLTIYKNDNVLHTITGTLVSGKTFVFNFDAACNIDNPNDSFEFKLSANTTLSTTPIWIYQDIHEDSCNYPGKFFIVPNLPDMTCADFLFNCMALAGVFPYVEDDDATVLLFPDAGVLINNISNAKDWSNKLVKTSENASELEDAEFTIDGYAKKNYLKYKEDDKNTLDTSGYMEVDNDCIEPEKDLVKLTFAAGKRFSASDYTIDYPLYDISKTTEGIGMLRKEISQSNDVIAKVERISGVDYLKFPDSLKFSSIAAGTNYAAYQNLLQYPRVLKERVILSAKDISELDLRIPICLQQYGKYYAILELQAKVDEESEIKLLEIKNIGG